MPKSLVRHVLFFCLLLIPCSAFAQASASDISGCELAKNPENFDGKLIRVRGRLNVYFEDFSLGFPNCDSKQGVWLAFGGDVPGVVASMVNDNVRKPGFDIKVNGVSYGIKKDDNFRKLYALIASRHEDKPDYRVTATLTGVFFAGEKNKVSGVYVGYGHMGCCSLLMITQASDVISDPPANLYIHGVVIGPRGEPIEGLTVINDVLGGSPPVRQTTVTSASGEFAFSNSGQELRIESPSYRPLAITAKPGDEPIRVKLQDANRSDWILRACSNEGSSGRVGFSVLFAIPPTMQYSPFDSDGMRSFFVYRKGAQPTSAELIVSHDPSEGQAAADSRDTTWFEERWIKNDAGSVIGIDARGRMERGGYLRSVTLEKNDSAGYRLTSGKRPAALDRILDSACLAKRSPQ